MSSDPTASLEMAHHETTTPITDTETAKPEGSRQSSPTASLENVVQQFDEVAAQEKGATTADSDHARAGPTKIPRSRRRGLLASWSLVPEVTDPKEYPRRTKWFITFVIAAAAIAAPMGSAIFFPALPELSRDLQISPTVTNLSVALYMLSLSICPLWWSSFSETLGRRSIYLSSFLLFIIFNVLCAVSRSITMLVIFRILVGGSAGSVQAVGAGTIADIWHPRERGQAMGIFYLGPLTGPLIAPIIGGAMAQRFGWRSTMWFMAMYGLVVLILLLFCLPETLPIPIPPPPAGPPPLTRVSTRQSISRTTRRSFGLLKRFIIDPLAIILYLRYPAVLITVYYAAITFGSLYVLNVSIQDSFSKSPYNFSTFIIGLLYIPPSLGYVCSSILGGRWTDYIMAREARSAGRFDPDGHPILRPEDRMRENAWIAAVVYPSAMIWYGWTVEKGVFWFVPMVALFFFGVGSMLIFAMVTTMLTEFMPKRASSGVALNNFVRNIFSAVGGAVAAPAIHGIGNGWVFTILGIWAGASAVVIWAMRHYGPRWRVEMDRHMK